MPVYRRDPIYDAEGEENNAWRVFTGYGMRL
jgi:hypothetical protein